MLAAWGTNVAVQLINKKAGGEYEANMRLRRLRLTCPVRSPSLSLSLFLALSPLFSLSPPPLPAAFYLLSPSLSCFPLSPSQRRA